MASDLLPSAGASIAAVIGFPVKHSLSPAIHNAAFRRLGLDFVYVALSIEDLASAMTGLRAVSNLVGLSVTIPHKVAILAHLDEIESTAAAIGAVNTVTRRQGRLVGSNTDGRGAARALIDAGADPRGRRVLLLGAGGAARAIAFTLALEHGIASLWLTDAVAGRAQELAAAVEQASGVEARAVGPLENAVSAAVAHADMVIHCTPVGMWPNVSESVLRREDLRPGLAVMDIVYNPLETELLRRARAAGCLAIPGTEMFLNQAALQFREWTGLEPPVDVMREALLGRLVAPQGGGK